MVSHMVLNMFLLNKYTLIYFSIIHTAIKQNRKKHSDVYYEKHHIYPKSIWTEHKSSKWNIVLLTAKEHYICHKLLSKMFMKGSKEYGKMIHAIHRMINSKNINYKISAKEYDRIKTERSYILSIEKKGKPSPLKNRKNPKQSIRMMGKDPWNKGLKTGKPAWNNGLKTGKPAWNTGLKMPTSPKKGKTKYSSESIARMAQSLTGRSKNPTEIKLMSIRTSQKTHSCIFCKKSFNAGNYSQHIKSNQH